jgi:hypothetical protein
MMLRRRNCRNIEKETHNWGRNNCSGTAEMGDVLEPKP